MFKKYSIDYDLFKKMYLDDNLSCVKVAEFFNISERTARYIIDELKLRKTKQNIAKCRTHSVIEKYGVRSTLCTQENMKKSRKTCVEKYGCEYPMQNKSIKQKQEMTNIKKYGVKSTCSVKEIREKQLKTNKERYGFTNPTKSEIIKDKILKTKKLNNSFNTSNPENEIYNTLTKHFGCVNKQYKTNEYPFPCDFYIPSKNLYIEYQGFCTHFNHPFDETNEKDISELEELKKKSEQSDLYKKIIETWTVRDPLKRKTAKDNNLNWIEFFTMDEFNSWFQNQQSSFSSSTK